MYNLHMIGNVPEFVKHKQTKMLLSCSMFLYSSTFNLLGSSFCVTES